MQINNTGSAIAHIARSQCNLQVASTCRVCLKSGPQQPLSLLVYQEMHIHYVFANTDHCTESLICRGHLLQIKTYQRSGLI